MRLLFVIPHFFDAQQSVQSSLRGRHGSVLAPVDDRRRAVATTVMSLHQTFGDSQAMIRHVDRRTVPANQSWRSEVHVILVTDGRHHLLQDLGIPEPLYHHTRIDGDPVELGFQCHEILRDRWGNYDFYAYLEDDLSIIDPSFFHKLTWFNSHVGDDKLLMPNRYERACGLAFNKCYLDGDLRPQVTAAFQDVTDNPELSSSVMGKSVRFIRPLNPHSGCFFLNHHQLGRWIEMPEFGSRDRSFIGPLESAATLGVMRAFQIYKPAPENAAFLEIQHAGDQFVRLIRKEASVAEDH